MNFKEIIEKTDNLKEAIICISFGTVIGILTYYIFLYFHIDIYGWNFGLVFAPLAAGYAETILAKKIIGEDIGAISAFILFLVTVIYGFIIANPTLGVNAITLGSIVVILQAAIPTVINYFFLVVIIGIISYFFGFFKKITDYCYSKIYDSYYKITGKEKPVRTINTNIVENELESNKKINDLNFIFITSSHPINKKIEIIDQFHATVILERDKRLIQTDPEKNEKDTLKMLKKAKDNVLIQIATDIKANGGNGILDLKIEYSLIGIGGDSFQITAMGMGVKFKD
ncbi:hypothetical protein [uncultured Methanobrevibacter sp.]|uniref:hypothetical protein n=1 Tax=uncultured Methanobrevibacter sp. TaxID=253161 RepID=UPI0026278556|nr:hypothetical protein [uncultured Methanobrevibacter sp.]